MLNNIMYDPPKIFLTYLPQMTKVGASKVCIVGCYFSSENTSTDVPAPYFEKIAAMIKRQTGTCVQAVLKNSLLLNHNDDKLNIMVS